MFINDKTTSTEQTKCALLKKMLENKCDFYRKKLVELISASMILIGFIPWVDFICYPRKSLMNNAMSRMRDSRDSFKETVQNAICVARFL